MRRTTLQAGIEKAKVYDMAKAREKREADAAFRKRVVDVVTRQPMRTAQYYADTLGADVEVVEAVLESLVSSGTAKSSDVPGADAGNDGGKAG